MPVDSFTFPKQFERDILGEALGDAQRLVEPFLGTCESPIELTFIGAFRWFVKTVDYTSAVGQSAGSDEIDPRCFVIWPQAKILNYRVDFLIGFRSRSVIVECDGRDFHHATRVQIERDRLRDRELADAGHRVIRFPGAQIVNEPFRCAADVALWVATGSFLSK